MIFSHQKRPMMDETDKNILNEIQSDFPISSRPYHDLGTRLNLSESEIIKRIRRLKDVGIIRRIGGNFDSGLLGFTSTLCAAKVPEEKVNHFAEVVNRYPGVTHNYLRNNSFNLWFTFIAQDMARIENVLKEIAEETGVTEILNLPSVRTFKINAEFKL